MIGRLLDILAVIIFLLIMTVPALLCALLDTPAGRIGLALIPWGVEGLVLNFVEGMVFW
ncbi:MAG: hypothetical protein H8D34_26855 [Chloroflexi bacterium]|nr:hypothetical protein [Chloroflexota bacterium]